MTPITFKPYGVRAEPPTIIAERIVSWSLIDYNGNYGTCIQLDTGNSINVGEWPADVEKKYRAVST